MRILAIDLGKNKSVACVYEAENGTTRFQKLPTGIPAIQNLLRTHRPDRVVIEICPSAGWVGDLVLAEGLELQIANTSAPAWRLLRKQTRKRRGTPNAEISHHAQEGSTIITT